MFFLLSTNPSSLVLPLHTPRRASWLVWCSFCSPHNCRSPYLSTHPSSLVLPLHAPRRASWLVWCSICYPYTPCRFFYLYTHPDEPRGSSGVLSALHTTIVHLTSPHTPRHSFYLSTHQDEPLGSSGVLSDVHTPLIACFTSPHTQTSLLALLVFFLLSTQCRRSPYLSRQPSSLALPRNFNPIRVNSCFSTLHLTLLLFLTDCAQVPQCRCSYRTALILDSNLRGLHLACHS